MVIPSLPLLPKLDSQTKPLTFSTAPTAKQTSFLNTLSSSKGVEVDTNNLNKSETSQKIDELKNKPDGAGGSSGGSGNAASAGEPIQDPSTWTTGDEGATGKQMGYIAVMAKKANEEVPGKMGKSEASEKIGELKDKTGM